MRTLGPGFLSGMAGNDATAVTSYSVVRVTNGYGQLWLMLISTPPFQAVHMPAPDGRVTQMGLAGLLRETTATVAAAAPPASILANPGADRGDLVAVGSGLELIQPVSRGAAVLSCRWRSAPSGSDGVPELRHHQEGISGNERPSRLYPHQLGIVSDPDCGARAGRHVRTDVGRISRASAAAAAPLGRRSRPKTMFVAGWGEKEERRPGLGPSAVPTGVRSTSPPERPSGNAGGVFYHLGEHVGHLSRIADDCDRRGCGAVRWSRGGAVRRVLFRHRV